MDEENTPATIPPKDEESGDKKKEGASSKDAGRNGRSSSLGYYLDYGLITTDGSGRSSPLDCLDCGLITTGAKRRSSRFSWRGKDGKGAKGGEAGAPKPEEEKDDERICI